MKALQQVKGSSAHADVLDPSRWDGLKLHSVLGKFTDRKILVVGDLGVDRYTIGSVERISPEAPVPVLLVDREEHKLGLAANVGDNVRALRGEAECVGVVGEDRVAQDLRALFKKAGINAARIVADPSRRTVLKERLVTERQQLLRVDHESLTPLGADVEKRVIEQADRAIAKCDAVILEDYAKGSLTEKVCQTVIKRARRAGKLVAVDPNAKTPVDWYKGASLIKPNRKEAEELSGVKIVDEASLEAAGRALQSRTKARWVVITLGRDGMAIFEKGYRGVRKVPSFVREVYDVSGAGDTVIAVLTLALCADASIEEAVVLANLAAGVEVGKRGTATVTPEEIVAALEEAVRG